VVIDVAYGVAVGLAAVGGAAVGVAVVGVAVVGTLGVVVLFPAVFGAVIGVAYGINFGRVPESNGYTADTFVAFFTALFRFPVYLFEVICQVAARAWNSVTGRSSLRWVPVLHHELSYLPHPFLEGHLLAEADADPALTRWVLDACSIAPGQRKIGRRVEATLRAKELKRLSDANDFQALAELRGLWLPGVQGADGVLLGFSEAGRYLTAAQTAFNPHHQLKHLEGLATQLNAIENQLRSGRNALTQPFEEPLEALRHAGRTMRVAAEKRPRG
jgi:hypothetical protein